MSDKKISRTSFTISVLIHALLLLLFMMLNLSFEYEPSEYVELSFGVSTEGGSSGSEGNQVEEVEEITTPEEKTVNEEKNKEVKEVDLPIAENVVNCHGMRSIAGAYCSFMSLRKSRSVIMPFSFLPSITSSEPMFFDVITSAASAKSVEGLVVISFLTPMSMTGVSRT